MADQNTPAAGSGGSGLAPNVASLLCYLCSFITGIIFLLIEKDNKEVRFHAWQSIFLGAAYFVVYIALTILSIIMGMMSAALATIFGLFGILAWLAFFILTIVCMVRAYQGQRWKVPYIGDIAEKQTAK